MTDHEWLVKIVPEKLPWIKNAVVKDDACTVDEFMRIWVQWLIKMSFVQVFGQQEGYIIARPAKLGWVFDVGIDYWATLFMYEEQGEVIWIDSLWAPGFYPEVLATLKRSQKPYAAWEHQGKLYFKVIRELSGSIPSKKEIAEGFVRKVSI